MFAQNYASWYLLREYRQLMEDIKKSKYDRLDICHHFTSGMKSVFTQDVYDGLLLIR